MSKSWRKRKVLIFEGSNKFQFKENQNSFYILLIRYFQIKNKDSLILIGFEIWFCQSDGVGTEKVTRNGFSQVHN